MEVQVKQHGLRMWGQRTVCSNAWKICLEILYKRKNNVCSITLFENLLMNNMWNMHAIFWPKMIFYVDRFLKHIMIRCFCVDPQQLCWMIMKGNC